MRRLGWLVVISAALVAAHPDVPTGWVDVVGDRTLSLWIAEATGVKHESPQALWVVDGAVVWSASHFSITATALSAACTVGDGDDEGDDS